MKASLTVMYMADGDYWWHLLVRGYMIERYNMNHFYKSSSAAKRAGMRAAKTLGYELKIVKNKTILDATGLIRYGYEVPVEER